MNDKSKSVINQTKVDIEELLDSKLNSISKKSIEYIDQVENVKTDAKTRFENFMGRKKWLDILIIINLSVTPIILALLIYWTFVKK